MRLHILSDLHLEFSDFSMPNVDADVRILAGDVHTRERGVQFAIEHASAIPTLYVAGNHEFYGTAIPRLYEKMKAKTTGTSVTVLENDEFVLGDVRFLGCTLWTDFGLHGPESRDTAMLEAKATMTDYRKIRVSPSYRKLTPNITYAIHRRSLSWLESRLTKPFPGKSVVITHHAPSSKSVMDDTDIIASAYSSCLEEFIQSNPIDLWVHGHTHKCVDYRIGATRVVSNSRGYPGECIGTFDPNLVVTV